MTGFQTYKACSVEKVLVALVHACVNVCKTVGVYVHVYVQDGGVGCLLAYSSSSSMDGCVSELLW